MSITTNEPTARKPLRLWPGVMLAVLLCAVRWVGPLVLPEYLIFSVIGGVVCALAILVWWLLFSRASWVDRVGGIAVMAIALYATFPLVDVSIRTGMQGMMLPLYAVPALCIALVASVAVSRRFSNAGRRVTMVVAILLACGLFLLLRTAGIRGGGSDLAWRWTRTPEQRLLAQTADDPLPPPPPPASQPPNAGDKGTPDRPAAEPTVHAPITPSEETPTPATPALSVAKQHAEWPGFRGPDRDSVIHGVRISTDWMQSPPVQLWRRPIGPGWSSFAVDGDMIYTQEQRGDDEVVTAYNATTGAPVWRHRDPVRFWESNGGAGPRGTPTLSNGRVYTLGATGIVNALDASTGSVFWTRNIGTDTKKEVPGWGFASSPLVIDDIVIVAATGSLVGYDAATGNPRWFGPRHRGGYSSPQRLVIDGVQQVLLVTADGVISVAPSDGTLLWEHAWSGVPIVQPAQIAGGDILFTTGDAMGALGMRRLAVTHGAGGWTAEERWTSTGLKPYFNDFVVHKGHAYGFDGAILACIDLENGSRKWKGGRYGQGQLVLLADQDVLLVLSEDGELALVRATPEKYTELARLPALDAKTWNHPVVVHDVLLIRNGEEMVAFRLPSDGTSHH